MIDRLKHIRRLFTELELDAVLLSSPVNIVYFSGFSGFSSLERDGYLLITRTAAYVLTSPLYTHAVMDIPHLSPLIYASNAPFSDLVKKVAAKHTLQRVGFEAENLTVSEWKHLSKVFPKFVPVDLRSIRISKSPAEIISLTKAAEIADASLAESLSHIQPDMTETDIVRLLEDRIRAKGADIAFPAIVAFGQNAAVPHHKSDGTKLKRNDLILIDFGASYQEYRSDMTRTFFIGKATQEQKKAYQAVLNAQQQAVAYITSSLSEFLLLRRESSHPSSLSLRERVRVRGKIKASTVDKVARDYLTSLGYPSIPHSLGHGIGLAVHEAPSLSPKSQDFLEEGMVFSLEPGVYLPDKFGIRIEDLYTIQDGKLAQLTHAPSTLLEK